MIDALRRQLSDPAIVREYANAYREERNRAENNARRQRATLEKEYAKNQSEVQRVVSSIAKGLITEDEAASLLDTARREIARLEAELALANADTNVVELHPQAVQRFKDNVDALADILTDKDTLPDLELTRTFRSLVESVIVQPPEGWRGIRGQYPGVSGKPDGRRNFGCIDGSGGALRTVSLDGRYYPASLK